MGRRANGVSASPPGSACPGRPLHRSTPSLYPHHRAPRCTPQQLPPTPSLHQDPNFPLPFPHCLPHSASPLCQDPTISLLSFPTKFNLAETGDDLSLQRIPSPKEGAASTWIHTKRGLYGCSTTQELGGPYVFPHMLRSPIPTEAHGHATLFPPPPAGFFLEILPPWRQMGLYKNSGHGACRGGPSHCHLTRRERCKPLHSEPVHRGTSRGAFHELWQIPVLRDT